ncbi:hypothetical protein O3M35_008461 [Rhynocoris fuscipes]|uniref:Major facilitator superfamily (MFS) profile domain-containing protein n=1 Tax=Rhynocoris fuscipes TaxID=488301 RepID=A0AAW1D7L8_9HEMI
MQGIGSSCSSVACLGMLASRFKEDKERNSAIGIAFSGLALGAIIGPTFGGFMYEFVGRSSTFLILSAAILSVAVLQIIVMSPEIDPKKLGTKNSFIALIIDPYILVATGALIIPGSGIALLQSTLPIWMMDTMRATTWQLGAIFLPISILYFIFSNLYGVLGRYFPKWLLTLVGLIIIGVSILCIPFCNNIYYMLPPLGGFGLSLAVIDCAMMSELAHLVDIRFSSEYGSVFAIGDIAFCLAYGVGQLIGGVLLNVIGFQWMICSSAILSILYAPLMVMLRNPPTKENKQVY